MYKTFCVLTILKAANIKEVRANYAVRHLGHINGHS